MDPVQCLVARLELVIAGGRYGDYAFAERRREVLHCTLHKLVHKFDNRVAAKRWRVVLAAVCIEREQLPLSRQLVNPRREVSHVYEKMQLEPMIAHLLETVGWALHGHAHALAHALGHGHMA
jgi:hypothetical protein